jgi:hypothetical protein
MTTLYDDEKVDRTADLDVEAIDSDQDSTTQAIKALIEEDHDHEIKLRTMTWQRAAWLLCGDQVCLAIMAQSWSLSYVSYPPIQLSQLTNHQRSRLGPRHNHHARRRHSLLHHLPNDAQIHHETSSNQRHLRLWLLRLRQIANRVRIHCRHAPPQQHHAHRLPHFDRRQGPQHIVRSLHVHGDLQRNCNHHGRDYEFTAHIKPYLFHEYVQRCVHGYGNSVVPHICWNRG